MKRDILDCITEGKQIKEYRQLMGIKQIDMAELLRVNQCNLSHMESGQMNMGDRFLTIRVMFVDWRIAELKRLENQKQYLKSL